MGWKCTCGIEGLSTDLKVCNDVLGVVQVDKQTSRWSVSVQSHFLMSHHFFVLDRPGRANAGWPVQSHAFIT